MLTCWIGVHVGVIPASMLLVCKKRGLNGYEAVFHLERG